MKNEEMSLRTKQALATALKNAMKKKYLSKITVSELIKECDINRNTFYYHFRDIYDLLKWTLEQDTVEIVRQTNLLVDAEDALRFVIEYVENNEHIMNCAYDSVGYDKMKSFFYTDFIDIMRRTLDDGEKEMQISVDSEFKDFVAEFFTEALTGMLISWIKNKNKQDKEEVIQNVLQICKVSIPQVLREKAKSEENRA